MEYLIYGVPPDSKTGEVVCLISRHQGQLIMDRSTAERYKAILTDIVGCKQVEIKQPVLNFNLEEILPF